MLPLVVDLRGKLQHAKPWPDILATWVAGTALGLEGGFYSVKLCLDYPHQILNVILLNMVTLGSLKDMN